MDARSVLDADRRDGMTAKVARIRRSTSNGRHASSEGSPTREAPDSEDPDSEAPDSMGSEDPRFRKLATSAAIPFAFADTRDNVGVENSELGTLLPSDASRRPASGVTRWSGLDGGWHIPSSDPSALSCLAFCWRWHRFESPVPLHLERES
ncbi:MAG: hypothetical protein RI967_2433 [Planctomycetota bacterium]